MKKVAMMTVLTVSAVAQLVHAHPGFSEIPVNGSNLAAASDEDVLHVVSQLSGARTFKMTTKNNNKVLVTFLEAASAIEADPEIPTHLISVRGENDDAATIFKVDKMFVDSVKKGTSDSLQVAGSGGSSYECSSQRRMEIKLISNGTKYELKYQNVQDSRNGDKCDI